MTADRSLPTEQDFDPWGGDLDARWAWRNFGGKTLDQAREKFAESPIHYQEDFMFMGGKAFAFYFPVIEGHLRTVPGEYDDDRGGDRESWILANCIQNQFRASTRDNVRHLAERVLDLAKFVQHNIARFGGDDEAQARVAETWTELAEYIRADARSGS